jgi:hypothetical protein
MFSYFKKNKIISLSIILTSAVFIFSAQLNYAEAEDLPVIDRTQINISKETLKVNNWIANLLSGDTASFGGGGKGAEYYRLQSVQKLKEERALLKKLTESTVNMVNTANDGNPYYVTNINQYLRKTSDATIADFQKDPALNSICEPYKAGVKKKVGEVNKPTLKEKIQCGVDSTVLNDYNNGDNFSWDTWNQVNSAPQNTFLGSQLIALEEQQKRIDENIEAAKLEASWGNGFTSIKVCDPKKADPDKNYDGCDIKTPGEVIANRLNIADITNIEQMQRATDYNELTMILAEATAYSDPGSLSKPDGLQSNRNNTGGGNGTGTGGGTGGTGGGTSGGNTGGGTGTGTGGNTGGGNTGGNTGGGNTGGNTGGGTGTDYNTDGTIDFDISLSTNPTGQTTVNPTKALGLIDLQITTEIQYYNAQNNIYNLLDLTQTSFASSTAQACSTTIKNPIISQIIGYPAYDQTNSANLIWNKKDIERVSNIVVSNINTLNSARSSIISSSNNQAIITQVQNLANSTTMHSTTEVTTFSVGGTIYNKVKNWVASKVNTNLASCNINKTPFSSWGI